MVDPVYGDFVKEYAKQGVGLSGGICKVWEGKASKPSNINTFSINTRYKGEVIVDFCSNKVAGGNALIISVYSGNRELEVKSLVNEEGRWLT